MSQNFGKSASKESFDCIKTKLSSEVQKEASAERIVSITQALAFYTSQESTH